MKLNPTIPVRPPLLFHSNNPNEIALTFDDGPNEKYTPRLLEVLAATGVKATFFLIGMNIRRYPEIVRDISRAGHKIGNHTDTHPKDLATRTPEEVEKELKGCCDALEGVLGVSGQLFRPPYGTASNVVLRVAQKMGLKAINWSADGNDWDDPTPTTQEIVNKISSFLDRNQSGEIVLLHDGCAESDMDRTNSLEAAQLLIEKYRNKQFVLL